MQGSSGSQVVAGGFKVYKLGTFAWLAFAVGGIMVWPSSRLLHVVGD
jgi:hypothetical protein